MTTPGAGRLRDAWVILGGTALALLTASGVRSAVGVSEAEFGWEYGAVVTLLARLREMVVGNCRDTEAHARLFRDVLALD